jgi:lipid-A-disaccharide synthase
MRDAGVEILVDSTELGIVGFVEVFRHLPIIARIFYGLLGRASRERPDAIVLIDYPGFNVRIARRFKALGLRVIYYISPQVWAWGRRRIPKIARSVDRMLVIFPFEREVYAGTGLDVQFVGHPLIEILEQERVEEPRRTNQLLLLPGSRAAEVQRMLPVMLDTVDLLLQQYPDLEPVIAAPRPAVAELVHQSMARHRNGGDGDRSVPVVVGETHRLLQTATAGLAASGTVTVEAAILGLPLVVAYRLNPLTYRLCRLLVKIPFFTMVNLVAERLVYEEFLQDEAGPIRLAEALGAILPGGARRQEVIDGITQAVNALGGREPASRRAAHAVVEACGWIEQGTEGD